MTEEQARNDPRVLAGTYRPRRDARIRGGWSVRDIERYRAAQARYNTSERGRAARARFEASEKGREAIRESHARYKASEKGRITNILCCMRYNNKLADARDAALLQTLKGDRQ